ncbi:MAG: PIN domain-containing protein [Thermoanaerobaculia bacterium]
MTDRLFVDTNVFVYLYDIDSPEKQAQAKRILGSVRQGTDLVISTQVLQEFYVTVTRKFARTLSDDEIIGAMTDLCDLSTVRIDVRMIFDAIEIGRRFRLSFWDALVVQAALAAGCSRLLTEDLQHGQKIGNLTVENPFLPPSGQSAQA